ncbi:MAG: sigma-70 family RNA polymerase sigma factor [Acidobacteriota bacterium]|nr:sigma-70 family RNA polymerase sigma factor [Acidobacteriota bacterium]
MTDAPRSPRWLFEENLELIQRISGHVCRRNHCRREEAEEFQSHVMVKLLEDECAVLAKFEGRAKLSTYLTTVITRLFLDWRTAKWGKWRPSAAAKRLGPTAILLDRLLYRDHLSFAEAVRTLHQNHGVTESELELAALAGRLPQHSSRRFETDDGLEQLADDASPEEDATDAERRQRLLKAEEALAQARRKLPKKDRLILRLRFDQGLTVARIARMLDIPQRRLYTRIDRLKRELAAEMERQGLDPRAIREDLDHEDH